MSDVLKTPEFLARVKSMCDLKHTNEEIKDVYESVCYVLKKCVANKEPVMLKGVGVFEPVVKEGGTIKDRLHNKGDIEVPDRLTCKFRINNNWKLALREVDIKAEPKDWKEVCPNAD